MEEYEIQYNDKESDSAVDLIKLIDKILNDIAFECLVPYPFDFINSPFTEELKLTENTISAEIKEFKAKIL